MRPKSGRSVWSRSPGHRHWPQITSWGKAEISWGQFIDCGGDRVGAPTRTGVRVRELDGAWAVKTTVGGAVRLGMGMVQRLSRGRRHKVLERWNPGNERGFLDRKSKGGAWEERVVLDGEVKR